MSAPKHNTNAVKGSQAATSWLQIRVTPADKADWVRAASRSGHVNLTEWVIANLNTVAARSEPRPEGIPFRFVPRTPEEQAAHDERRALKASRKGGQP